MKGNEEMIEKEWIEKEILKNPEIAEDFKKQRLAWLQTKLKYYNLVFNREDQKEYRDVETSLNLIQTQKEIARIERTPEQALLVEEFVKRYLDLKIDESEEQTLQNLIDEEVIKNKYALRDLAKINVGDAFKQMGAEFSQKDEEKIDKIIELHDPKVVEKALKNLSKNPTKNFIALAESPQIKAAMAKSKTHKKLGLSVACVLSAMLFTLGVTKMTDALIPNVDIYGAHIDYGAIPPSLAVISIGVLGIISTALGFKTLSKRYKNKVQDINNKLSSACIDDLLNEVVHEGTKGKNLGK